MDIIQSYRIRWRLKLGNFLRGYRLVVDHCITSTFAKHIQGISYTLNCEIFGILRGFKL